MASSLFLDPLQLWREAVNKLENDVNALATGSMKSQEVARSLQQFSTVSLGMQQVLEKAIEAYLRRANLPSRKELEAVAETLQRIEHKIDQLLPAEAVPVPRPARTRRPQGAAPAAAAAPAPAPAPRPARTRGRSTTRRAGKP